MVSKAEIQFFDYFDIPMDAMYLIGVGPKTEWVEYKRRYPKGHLFGCEPHPESYEKMKSSFTGTLFNEAIDEVAGEVDFYPAEVPMQSSFFKFKASKGHPIKVSAITLDQFDLKCGKQDNILLWMDIEGAELRALKGGKALLESGRVKVINLEITDIPKAAGWCTLSELTDLLKGYGYRVLRTYNEQRTHRDIIYIR